MHWFVAKLVFQIVNHSDILQFEEQLRLIEAINRVEALAEAERIGEGENDEFLTVDQKKVLWKFIAVSDLHPLNDLSSGMELCSTIFEKSPEEDYISTVLQRREKLAPSLETFG